MSNMNLRKSSISSLHGKEDREDKNGENKCGTCQKVCKLDTDKVLVCQSCNRPFHTSCQKVNDTKYSVLKADIASANPTTFWFCNSSCNLFAARFMTSMIDMKKFMIDLKEDVDNVKTHVLKMDQKVSDIDKGIFSEEHEKKIRSLAKEEFETEMNERLTDEERAEFTEERQEQTVSQAVREMSQRQARKKYFLVHGAPMCKSKEIKARIDYDKRFLDTVLSEGLGLKGKVVARKITRLGKKDDNERPMRVQLDNPQLVSDIVYAAKSLKENEKFKDVSIVSDRTPLERAEWRKLVKLRNERQAMSDEQQDGVKWIIVGHRVVKERQVNRENQSEVDEDPSQPEEEGGDKWQ